MRLIIFAMALASGSAFVPSPKARLAATPTTAARAVVISQMPMPSTQRKFILFDLDGSHHKEQMRLKAEYDRKTREQEDFSWYVSLLCCAGAGQCAGWLLVSFGIVS